jgi:hypothetical protein
MIHRSNVSDSHGLAIRAHRRYPVGLALVSLLVCVLTPVAVARPDDPSRPQLHRDDRLPLAGELVATTTQPGRTIPNEPPRTIDAPVSLADLPAGATGASYVDPAGGHPPVRPIETSNPYRVR